MPSTVLYLTIAVSASRISAFKKPPPFTLESRSWPYVYICSGKWLLLYRIWTISLNLENCFCVPKEIDICTEYFKYFFSVYFLSSGNTSRVFTVIGSLQNCDFYCFSACNSHRYFFIPAVEPLYSDKWLTSLSRLTHVMILPLQWQNKQRTQYTIRKILQQIWVGNYLKVWSL